MRTGNFRNDILHPVAGKLGIDHTSTALRVEHIRGWIPDINLRMEEAWETLDLPELRATEERAFRTIWNSTGQFLRSNAQGLPDEFLWLETGMYYRVKAAAAQDPPIGTEPSDTDYFEPVLISAPYIDLDQRGRHAVGEVLGVYTGDPMPQWSGWRGLPYRLSERGIELQGAAGRMSVWLRFKIRPSKFSAEQWENETVYQKRALIYQPETGQVYRSLVDGNQGIEPPANVWAVVPVPSALATFVALSVAGDQAEDISTAQKYYAMGQASLARKFDQLGAQGERRRYRLFPKRRAADVGWCSSPSCLAPAMSEVTTLSEIWTEDEHYTDDMLVTESGEAILA